MGRFGPFVQRGDGDKPKRAGIPKGVDASDVDLDYALKLLALPREIGIHPESGKEIKANFGRFGPYVVHDGQFASLESAEDVFTVGLNRAVTLLAEKKARAPARRGPEPLKELGPHPQSGALIKLMRGRFGPYVTDGTVNATIPKQTDPLSLELTDAVTLIDARATKGGGTTARRKAASKLPASAAARGKKEAKGTKSATTAKATGKKPPPAKTTARTKRSTKPAGKKALAGG
jgi:DNA topoisomerase-1